MKDLSGHIKYCIIALACVLTLGSCVFDDYPDNGQSAGGTEDPDQAFLVLHISPVNTTRAQNNNGIAEKIKSLRIIMLNTVGNETTIECNERITTDDRLAEGFTYAFRRKTDQGKKKFYFIANEDEVTNIIYPSQTAADKNKTLKELLDAYKESDDAAVFETWINSVYFEPTYTIENDEIYLPYTAFYEDTEVRKTSNDKWENLIQPDMYLVPVATKFFFKFINYHKNDVEIKNLSIKSIASQNFLMGHVDEDDQTKDFDGVKMYWVDWLAKVAEETQFDSEGANKRYGWISKYQMPQSNQHKEAVLISEGKNNVKTIEVSTDDHEVPLPLGPYYLPESCQEETYKDQDDNDVTEQVYNLYLHLHDTEVANSESGDFKEELRIGNVKALFRDTYVLITVTMKNGDVEAYGEIKDWGHSVVEGWADGGSLM